MKEKKKKKKPLINKLKSITNDMDKFKKKLNEKNERLSILS